jgi:hypothetical protein
METKGPGGNGHTAEAKKDWLSDPFGKDPGFLKPKKAAARELFELDPPRGVDEFVLLARIEYIEKFEPPAPRTGPPGPGKGDDCDESDAIEDAAAATVMAAVATARAAEATSTAAAVVESVKEDAARETGRGEGPKGRGGAR